MCVCMCLCSLLFTLGEGPDLSGGSHIGVVGTIMRGLFWGVRACDVGGVAGESDGGVGGDRAANGVDGSAND